MRLGMTVCWPSSCATCRSTEAGLQPPVKPCSECSASFASSYYVAIICVYQ